MKGAVGSRRTPPRVKRSRPRPRSGASQPSVFHAIRGSRAFEEVVDQLTFAIRSGHFAPGDRLPNIAQLATTMEVSKPTIGLAIRSLAGAGVLRVLRGATGGVVVNSSNIPVTLLRLAGDWQQVALSELLEARRPIEMTLALLAGERASEEDFRRLRSAVQDLERARQTKNQYAWLRADHLFHYSLGRAARSELLAYYQHQILERLAKLLNYYEEQYRNIDDVIGTHRRTLLALESRDPRAIRRAMEEHLGGLED